MTRHIFLGLGHQTILKREPVLNEEQSVSGMDAATWRPRIRTPTPTRTRTRTPTPTPTRARWDARWGGVKGRGRSGHVTAGTLETHGIRVRLRAPLR